MSDPGSPTFLYELESLPPGRVPFRRWRWELWHGPLLLGAGWTTAPEGAERALRRTASQRAHELRGVRALRADRARLLDGLRPGAVSRLETGVGRCLLVPRGAEAAAFAA